jgi:hypothetical protein
MEATLTNLLRDVSIQLGTINAEIGNIKNQVHDLSEKTDGILKQTTIANGRTAKLEDKVKHLVELTEEVDEIQKRLDANDQKNKEQDIQISAKKEGVWMFFKTSGRVAVIVFQAISYLVTIIVLYQLLRGQIQMGPQDLMK